MKKVLTLLALFILGFSSLTDLRAAPPQTCDQILTAAKARALADPHIQDLQSAMDGATGDDAKAASRRYYKALYEKMREIDPSVKDRIDRTEAATMRRVEQEQ